MNTVAAEEYFHLNSVACWVPGVIGVVLLGISLLMRARVQMKVVVAAFILAVGLGSASLAWYSHAEQTADGRDAYVVSTLKKSGVKFEGFQDNDTERVRVSRVIDGKKCSATYDVMLGDYGGKWPLHPNSGRFPSKECGLDHVDSSHGLRGHRGSDQAIALNRVFVDPYASKKWAE